MELIHVDKDIVVCIKPARVLSTDEPGGMPELVRQALGDPNADVRTVHRLDRAAVPMLALQTIAANLGSMATPVGNPQNLFLYAYYDLSAGEFFSTVLPLAALSLVCLTAASLSVLPKKLPELQFEKAALEQPGKLTVYGVQFVLCLLTVFRVLHYGVLTAIVLIAIAVV